MCPHSMMDTISVYAAPLQGYTEAAWRNAHERVFGGVDAYYAPFARLEKGEMRNKDKRELSVAQNTVRHLVPQVVAATPEELRKVVEPIVEAGYKEVDLNMGCPFPMIVNRGKGSGLLVSPERVKALLDEMAAMPEVCFSVKMRLGWKDSEEWEAILPLLNDSCVRQVVLHARIGKQQYKGVIDETRFGAFYELCRKPLVYNGDLRSADDIKTVMEKYPLLKGVMLGRGLLADPSLAVSFRNGGKPVPQSLLYSKVYEMHQQIYEHYARTLEGGEGQILMKLKPMWEYLLPQLEKKSRKAIQKSTRLETYLQAVRVALSLFA